MTSNSPYNQILLFGDSITEMSYDPNLRGYGARLTNAYQRRMDVVVRGFSGYNTDWALPILKQLLPTVKAQQERATSIALMAIFFGANDGSLEVCPQHVPLDRYKSNVKALIDLVRNPDSIYYNPKMRLILITPPPMNEVQWDQHCLERNNEKGNRSNESVRKYADCIKDIGRETNIPVADIWTTIMDKVDQENKHLSDFLLDGLHLNANGYEALYKILMDIISEKYPDIHPDALKLEIPYWRELLNDPDYAEKVQFPLLKK